MNPVLSIFLFAMLLQGMIAFYNYLKDPVMFAVFMVVDVITGIILLPLTMYLGYNAFVTLFALLFADFIHVAKSEYKYRKYNWYY